MEVSATTAPCPAPDPPTNVQVATTHDLVGITWTPVAGATDYYVFRWMDDGDGNWLWNWLGPRRGMTYYTDTYVTCEQTYYY